MVARPASRRLGIWALGFGAFLFFFFLALTFLWPLAIHPSFVPFAPRAQFSDLLITHLPNAEYIRDSLARYGQLPLWNAQILAGQPFAADPLAGLWYPPNALLLFLPLPFAFNLLFAAHLAWAGYGLFRFLRAEGLNSGPALLGALAFAGTPKLIAHIGAGHASLIFAVAWTPWILLAVKRAVERGGLRSGALAGLCLALTFLADVRWAFYAGALAVAFWISLLPPFGPRREHRRGGFAALGFAFIFLSLVAILALPLAQFVMLSSRGALTLDEAAAYSLPPIYLLGLVIPNLGGFHEWMTYVSVIPLLLACAGIQRRTMFWLVAVIAAAAFALGSNFIVFPLLFRILPGLGFLRVPPRAWFIVAIGLCILAAHGARVLRERLLPRYFPRLTPHASRFTLLALLCLTWADLLRVNSTLLEARPLPGRVPAAQWIASQPGLFRVYSPSYSLPLGDGLQHVDGVNPLQLAASVNFIARASGVPARGYSVTVPAFASDDIAAANAPALPNVELLGELNVKYVAAEFPMAVSGLNLVQTVGRTRIYENADWAERAWVSPQGEAIGLLWSPNHIAVRAAGPGTLVLSEVVYPGWEARVDGVLTPINSVDGLLRSVSLPPGSHIVDFSFRPRVLYGGAAITALGLLALLGILRWGK